MYAQVEQEFHCRMCGTRKYGAEASRIVDADQINFAEQKKAEEAARIQREAERKEQLRLEAERRKAARLEAERLEAARLEAARLEAERPVSRYKSFDLNALRAELEMLENEQKRLLQALDENSLLRTQVNQRLTEETIKVTEAAQSRNGLLLRNNQASEIRRLRTVARASVIAAGTPIEALCASPWCINPPGPNGRRYCGKKCSDDVARDTYAAKKAAAKKAAAS